MKTKTITKRDKTLIEQLREIRDKINLEIKDMTFDELKDYLKKKKTLHPTAVWRNGE
jgi:hypothetical protein